MPNASKSFLIIFLIFFIIIFFTTLGISHSYFEQDEWGGFADTIIAYNLPWWSFFASKGVHFLPLGTLFWKGLYQLFGFHAEYYHIVQLVVHAVVSTLVFLLTLRLTKNKIVAVITSILFLINSRAHQAFTHLSIFNTTDMAMIFILLFFVYLSGIKEKIFPLKKVMILVLIFFIANCFREESIMIIPLFITYIVAFDRSKINKANLKNFLILIASVVLFLSIRFYAQSLNTSYVSGISQISGRGVEYNLLTLYPKYIIQNLIQFENVVAFLANKAPVIYPETVTGRPPVNDVAFFYIFSLLVIIFLSFMWYAKPKKVFPVLLFCLVWIGVNTVLLAFVGRNINVLEPRYLYFSAFPVFCLFSLFIYHLYAYKYRFKIISLICKSVAILLVSFLVITSLQEIRATVDIKSKFGIARETVLENLHRVHPQLEKNTIFYINCKNICYRNSEFGIENKNVLPFTSGPGMIILATYARGQEEEWGPFLDQNFLWDIYTEGYKKIGDRSYGYFTTKDNLQEAIKKYNISKDTIVALEYDEEKYSFKDISNNFRKDLK